MDPSDCHAIQAGKWQKLGKRLLEQQIMPTPFDPKVSGYLINERKSTILGLNSLQDRLKDLCKATWTKREIRYLGIKISADPRDLLVDNIVEYKIKMGKLLQRWQKLPLL